MTTSGGANTTTIELLWEAGGLAAYPLPPLLTAMYGGGIGFPDSCLYANFVASLDGVTTLDPAGKSSNKVIADNHPADRLIMGLLRACADAVIMGAGTVRAHRLRGGDPVSTAPQFAEAWSELRSTLRRSAHSRLVVVTGRGDLDPGHPAWAGGALVITTDSGAVRLAGRLPSTCTVASAGPTLEMANVLAVTRAEGHRVILTEGGPHLLGEFLQAGLLDELFLTVSPVIAGRRAGDQRLGLTEGPHFLPGVTVRGRLLSVRRSDAHLFLRYSFAGKA